MEGRTGMSIFKGDWKDVKDLMEDFEILEEDLEGYKILLAIYTYESYDGTAVVLLDKGGELYYNTAGHCSCYGLEGQFEPEPIDPTAYMHTLLSGKTYGPEADFKKDFVNIVARYVKLAYDPSQQGDTDDDV